MTQVMQLVDKDIKTALITMLHMFKKVEEGVSMLRRKKSIKKLKLKFVKYKIQYLR